MTPSPLSDDGSQKHAHLLQLAYQGDGAAIATLMNRHLNRHQITASVTWEGNRLHVLLEAARIPDTEPLVSVIYRTILKLQVPTLKALKVSCQKPGSLDIVWSHEQSITPNLAGDSDLLQPPPESPQPPVVAPISLADWLSQKAQTSLAELIQPLSDLKEPESAERFLRFSFSPSETALLALGSIRQVLQVQSQSLLKVPDMPGCVVGICNFHGEMLWMVDLGLQLGFQGSTIGQGNRRSQAGMAIVIQSQGKSLGLIVPQVIDIESHDLTQLQPATADLFPATLLPFIQGYLVRSSSPVLDASTLLGDRRLQIHAAWLTPR